MSLFDGSLQGFARTDRPAFCVQGHPEASPGPHDVNYLFGRFVRLMDEREVLIMPKRTDIKSILIIGAGPIVIGQACEFDYSGAQACKALKEEGYRVILVNSNPATIMTDPGDGGRDLHRARQLADGGEDHRASSGPTRSCRPWAGRPGSTARSTSRATACSRNTAWR